MKRLLITSAIILVTLLAATIYAVDKLLYPDKVTVQAHKVCDCDFGDAPEDETSLTVGPENDPLVLTTNISDLPDTKDSIEQVQSDSQAGKVKCTLYHFRDGKLKTIPITSVPGPFLLPQPCGLDRYLIATASRFSPEKELNAFVYNGQGEVTNKLKLGVDINQMQCDSDGNAWATYNTTQKHDDPLNAAGLTCTDINGRTLFRYNSDTLPQRMPEVVNGLTLNVVSPEAVVVGSAKRGEIIKLLNKTSVKPVGMRLPDYCEFMAISDERLLYCYGTMAEARLAVVDIKSKRTTNLNPVDENGQSIDFKEHDVACRGSRLYFHNHKTIYYLDVNELDKKL